MTVQLIAWITAAWDILLSNGPRIAWNLFLAFLPWALSVWLFRERRSRSHLWWIALLLLAMCLPKAPLILKHVTHFLRDNRTNYVVWTITLVLIALDFWLLGQSKSRSFIWWVGFLVFIAFLPNAPYVLTDVIHLIEDIRSSNYSAWMITLVLIPQYLLFILGGFEAYVLSLINLGEYLKRQGWGKSVLWVELVIHVLSAVGIYLGRFLRFNSWDFVTQPKALAHTVVDDLATKGPVLVMAVTFVVISVLYWIMKQVSLGIMERQARIAAKYRKSNPNSQQIRS